MICNLIWILPNKIHTYIQPLSMREFSGYGYGTNEHARRRNETEVDLQTSLCQWNFPVLTLQETAHYNASL